ncbi:MAG: hypothetical protein ABL958_11015 [Bdellovibrionia bacterium]
MKRVHFYLSGAILFMAMLGAAYTNCSGDSGKRSETITGNPDVELSFGPYSGADGIEMISFCVSRVTVTLGSAQTGFADVTPNVEVPLTALGAEFGKVSLPAGTYIKLEFELSTFCDSGKSFRLKNEFGEFSSVDRLGITFTGNLE